jgi:hypothetical protein
LLGEQLAMSMLRLTACVLLYAALLSSCRRETPAGLDGTNTDVPFADETSKPAAQRRDAPRLLIVGDGFDDGAEAREFDAIYDNLTQGLKDLPGAAPDGSSIDVRPARLQRVNGNPQLAIFHEYWADDCYFELKPNALENAQVQRAPNFEAQRFLIVNNANGGGAGGCSRGDVMFIAKDVSVDTLAHELGHGLAGLFDERGLQPNDPPPATDARNCSSKPKPDTPWNDFFDGSDRRCNHFAKFFRPTDRCKMQSPRFPDFCDVCKRHLRCVMEKGQLGGCVPGMTISFPPRFLKGAKTVTEVVAAVTGDQIDIMSAREIPVAEIEPHIVRGETFAVVYEILSPTSRRMVGVGSLPIDAQRIGGETKFFARAYGPNDEGIIEDTIVEVPTGVVRLTLVGIPPSQLAGRNLRLEFKYYEQARKAFILNDFLIDELQKLGFTGSEQTSLGLK